MPRLAPTRRQPRPEGTIPAKAARSAEGGRLRPPGARRFREYEPTPAPVADSLRWRTRSAAPSRSCPSAAATAAGSFRVGRRARTGPHAEGSSWRETAVRKLGWDGSEAEYLFRVGCDRLH